MKKAEQKQIKEQNRIKEQIAELQKLYEALTSDPQKPEEALCACVFYVTRLLDEVLQMSTGDMEHEQQIFCGAMIIFVNQFISQVKDVKNLTGDQNSYEYIAKKRTRVEDIENAVEKVLTAYRNVIDSVANMDRHMLVGLTAGVNAYDLSPKLCAAYSHLLSSLTKLMGQEEDYAFLLNPTMKSIVRTEELLECREEHGRVVIINMPERMAERSDLLPIILIHEAYHVLNLGESRLRRERARSYIQNVYSEIVECLFHGTKLQDGIKSGKEQAGRIREKLLLKWFGRGRSKLQQYLNEDEDPRQFYGYYLAGKVRDCIEEDLKDLVSHLEEDVMNCYFDPELVKEKCFSDYEGQFMSTTGDIEILEQNAHALICNGALEALEELFLFVYREVYSDLACVTLLGLNADQYDRAFDWSKMSRMPQSEYTDNDRIFRQYLVARTYSQNLERRLAETGRESSDVEKECAKWKEMAERYYNDIKYFES